MQIPEEGLTLLQLAKQLKVQPKRLLAWEYNGHYEPPFRRKGRRLVRFYPPALVEVIAKAVELVQAGYGPKMAFYMARRGESPAAGHPSAAKESSQ